MSDNFERRQPTAAEVAHGLGLEVDLLRARIAELEAEVERLRAERWEPVGDGFDIESLDSHDYLAVTELAGLYCVTAGGDTGMPVVYLPTNIRLCRKEAHND